MRRTRGPPGEPADVRDPGWQPAAFAAMSSVLPPLGARQRSSRPRERAAAEHGERKLFRVRPRTATIVCLKPIRNEG